MLTSGIDFCGGVYLGGKIVLTSAHCVANKSPRRIDLGVSPSGVHTQSFSAVKVNIIILLKQITF